MLRVEQVSHTFRNAQGTVPVLQDINISVGKGKMVALLGSSGSGKSTLLHLMAGLMKPDTGQILIADQDIVRMSENRLAEFRRTHIGFIFQAYELLANLTIRENVELPLVFQGIRPSQRKQRRCTCWNRLALSTSPNYSLPSYREGSSSVSALRVH